MKKVTPKLIELVKQEAKNLRKHATSEELQKLDINTLYGFSGLHCVYGQITGACTSKRADELISKCCHLVYDVQEPQWDNSNKLTTKNKSRIEGGFNLYYVSPIEMFIVKAKYPQIERLIKYLKGETKTLRLP